MTSKQTDMAAPVTAPIDRLAPDSDTEKRTSQLSASTDLTEKPPLPTPPTDEDYVYPTGFKLALAIAPVVLVAFLMLLDTSIVATAVPRITTEFHSLPDVGWYGSAYLLANCALQPSTGKLYTYLNAKWTFLAFLGLFELGSLLCGVANSSKMLIVGRAVAGLGASGIMNGAFTIIANCLPIHKRPLYLGVMMAVAQFGIVLGPIIGGALTQYTTWRWCFYINLPAGAVVAVLLVLTAIPSRHTKIEGGLTVTALLRKLDLFGFVLFAPAIIQCLLALEWGGVTYAWRDSRIIGLFCGAAGTLAAFLAWEYHVGDKAMIPFSMMRQRIVWSSCLVMFFFFGAMLSAAFYLPIWFQSVRGATPTLSGVYLLPMIGAQMVMAVISGFLGRWPTTFCNPFAILMRSLVGRLGYYLPWAIGGGALVSIGSGLFSTFSPVTSTAKWVGYEILAGAGRGCSMQMPIIAIQNTLPPSQNSVGMSTLVFFQTFGGALFLAVADTDFTSSLVKELTNISPPVNVRAIVVAGATGFRDITTTAELPAVLLAFNTALRNTFYLGAGACVALFIFSWGLGWKSVKKPKVVKPEA